MQVLPAPDCTIIVTVPTSSQGTCPLCGGLSGQVHSHYTRTLADLPSQGRVVAPMESFFGSLKTELDGDGPFDTRQAARTALFRAIEGWHNRQRLHSRIGYITPANKEHLAAAA